jgi:hypothetical protein
VLLSGDAAARLLADQQQLEQAGMNASPEAVRLACKWRCML